MSSPAAIPGWTADESPFHASELAAQERVGVRATLDARVRKAGIRNYMPDQHRQFFNELPFLLIGSVDADGQPWATMQVGRPGFLTTPDSRTLHIAGASLPGNPLEGRLNEGAFIGALGIQFPTRRRNRVNGIITTGDDSGLTMAVSQSFGNCAKYIQRREPCLIKSNPTVTADAAAIDAAQLGAADRDLIGHADTCFIASVNLDTTAGMARGVDISHKGGHPGFLRIDGDHTLTMPDFVGNSYFNTIGNLIHDPRAGLLFIDFELGDLLYLAADADIIWDGAEVSAFIGAARLLRFHIRKVRRTSNVLPIRWSPAQYAAELMRTGAGGMQQAHVPRERHASAARLPARDRPRKFRRPAAGAK